MTERPSTPPKPLPLDAWVCPRCARHIGRVVNGVLHEPNGDRSNLPCVRKCTRCGRVNRRLS